MRQFRQFSLLCAPARESAHAMTLKEVKNFTLTNRMPLYNYCIMVSQINRFI